MTTYCPIGARLLYLCKPGEFRDHKMTCGQCALALKEQKAQAEKPLEITNEMTEALK